jgi:hypothetical protein
LAGDWIKLEHATLDKPEVLRTAEMLNIHRREALGLFVEFWIWLDKNLSGICPDFVRNMSRKSLDEVLHMPGFAACLVSIGWAKFDDEGSVMHIINAERHNGNTAKTRALDAKRKKEKRSESVREMSGSKPDVSGTREEKRREDIDIPQPAKTKSKTKGTPLPEPFLLSDRVLKWAAAKGQAALLELHLEAFVSTCRAKGYKYVDWDEAFMNAIRNNWAKLTPLQADGKRRLAI